jgi:hypothetical protein
MKKIIVCALLLGLAVLAGGCCTCGGKDKTAQGGPTITAGGSMQVRACSYSR